MDHDERSSPSSAAEDDYLSSMELHGSILENLERAVASARRLRSQRVYSDTLTYWSSLIDEGLREQEHTSGAKSASLGAVIATLKSELVSRVGDIQTP